MRIDLKALLMEYNCPSLDLVHEGAIPECTLSFLQLRDALLVRGKILYEDLDNQVYVAFLRAGFGNMSNVLMAIQLYGNNIIVAGYAKEGYVKQKIWEKTFTELKDIAEGKKSSAPSRRWMSWRVLVLIVALTVLVICLGTFCVEVKQTMDATKAYNKAVNQFNSSATEYNNTVALTSIDNVSGLPISIDMLAMEGESFWDNAKVVFGPNNKAKILADAQTILNLKQQIDPLVAVVAQITVPTEDWVSERLDRVGTITETQAVTAESDPDDLLGEEGGFSACIYFTVDTINSAEVPGESVVEKGTDAGGAVEVYPTLEAAEARCEYLAGFDGTVLHSGSYAIVGTMVVRTSYKLTNEEQFNLTNAITSELTTLDVE